MRARASAWLGMAALVMTGCGPSEEAPVTVSSDALEWATARQFGTQLSADGEVARVDGAAITVGELALCLERSPLSTPTECLDEVVATRLLASQATEVDRRAGRVADARRAGLASVWLREQIDRPLTDQSVPQQAVLDFLSDPGSRLFVGQPELRRCSHLLVQGPEGSAEAIHALAARIRAEWPWPASVRASDLTAARHAFAADAAEQQLAIRAVESLSVHVDNADENAWPGLRRVVQPFADALFALSEPGELSEPVDTQFGTHLIVLEAVDPAVTLEPAEAESLARAELAQRQRSEALQAMLQRLTAEGEVVRHQSVDIFRLDDEALIRSRNAEIRETMRPE